MKFFNLDLHVAIIQDVEKIFKDLGHEVVSWNMSNTCEYFGIKQHINQIICQSNFRQLNYQMVEHFQHCYYDDLKNFDGFICCYPPSFSLLYDIFDKPIIIQNATRYEEPFTFFSKKWKYFNQFIKNCDLLKLVCNNKMDVEYASQYTGRKWDFITSLCEYVEESYQPEFDKILFLKTNVGHPDINHEKIENLSKFDSRKDLVKYKGIVYIPYNVSEMKIFEFYQMNIPLFIPSFEFMIKLWRENQYLALHNLSFLRALNDYYGNPNLCGTDPSLLPSNVEYDLNDWKSEESTRYWTQFADYYQKDVMPHIIHFNSFEHLFDLINTVDYEDVSEKMKDFNKKRKFVTYQQWERVLKGL
ncbi:MAG: hypothetical protein ACOC3V_03120 [bacterium]